MDLRLTSLLALFVTVCHIGLACEEAESCVEPLRPYVSQYLENALSVGLNRTQLQEACVKVNESRECLNQMPQNCMSPLFDITKTGEFICSGDKDEYVNRSYMCLGRDQLWSTMAGCMKNEFNFSITGFETAERQQTICSQMQDWMKCQVIIVNTMCQEKDALWMMNYLNLISEYKFKKLQCHLYVNFTEDTGASTTPVADAESCDIQSCLLELQPQFSNITSVANMTLEELDSLCATIENYKNDCLDLSKYQNCPSTVQDSINSMIRTFGYICNSDKQDSFQIMSCIGSVPVQDQTAVCTDLYNTQISNLSLSTMGMFCNLTDQYIWCILGIVEGQCGWEAAKYYANILAESMMPAMESMGCTLNFGPYLDSLNNGSSTPRPPTCDSMAMMGCMAAMSAGSSAGNSSISDMINLDLNVVQKQCESIGNMFGCVRPHLSSCSGDQQYVWNYAEMLWNNSCIQHKDDIENTYLSCLLQKPELQQRLEECGSYMATSTADMFTSNFSQEAYYMQICSNMQSYMDCVYKGGLSYCGKETAEWLTNLLYASTMPSLNIVTVCKVNISYSEECDIQSCMMELQPYFAKVAEPGDMTKEQLDDFCASIKDYSYCLDVSKYQNCSSNVLDNIKAMNSSLGYICDNDKQDSLQILTCISAMSVQEKISVCTNEYSLKMSNITMDIMAMACNWTDQYMWCILGIVEEQCGWKAAKYQANLLAESMTLTMEQIGCTLNFGPYLNSLNNGSTSPRPPTCDSMAMMGCMAALSADTEKSSVSDITGLNPSVILNQCQRMGDVFSCVSPHLSGCLRDQEHVWNQAEVLWSYACKQHKDDIEDTYLPCLMQNTEVQQRLEQCGSSMANSTADMFTSNVSTEAYYRQTCSYMQSFMDCAYQVALSFCGQGTADWMTSLLYASAIPSLNIFTVCNVNFTWPADLDDRSDIGTDCWAMYLCLEPMSGTLARMYGGQPIAQDTLVAVCRNFSVAESCMSDMVEDDACKEDQDHQKMQDMWHSAADFFDDICGDKQTDYMDLQQCLTKSTVTKALKKCNDTFNTNVERAGNRYLPGTKEYSKLICDYVNGLVLCMGSEVIQHCGRDVAVMYEEQQLMIYSTYLQSLNCAIKEENKMSNQNDIGSSGSLIIINMALLLISLTTVVIV